MYHLWNVDNTYEFISTLDSIQINGTNALIELPNQHIIIGTNICLYIIDPIVMNVVKHIKKDIIFFDLSRLFYALTVINDNYFIYGLKGDLIEVNSDSYEIEYVLKEKCCLFCMEIVVHRENNN